MREKFFCRLISGLFLSYLSSFLLTFWLTSFSLLIISSIDSLPSLLLFIFFARQSYFCETHPQAFLLILVPSHDSLLLLDHDDGNLFSSHALSLFDPFIHSFFHFAHIFHLRVQSESKPRSPLYVWVESKWRKMLSVIPASFKIKMIWQGIKYFRRIRNGRETKKEDEGSCLHYFIPMVLSVCLSKAYT